MRSSRGFTLVEILVGAAITTVALVVIYEIWFMISRNANTEIWVADINKKLTNTDTRMREYLARAGYASVMTSQGIRTPSPTSGQPNYRVKITNAGGTNEPEGGNKPQWRVFTAQGNETGTGVCLLSFYRVEPGTVGVEGKPNNPISCKRIQVFMRRPHRVAETKVNLVDLVMEEGICNFPGSDSLASLPTLNLDDPPTPTSTTPFTIATNAMKVRLSARTQVKITTVNADGSKDYSSDGRELATGDNVETPCVVRMEIDCVDPQRGQRHVFRRIEGEVHIGVDMTGSL